MDFILYIIVGALAGWIASIIMKKNAQMGWLANIAVGIVGGFLGGWLLSLVGLGGADNLIYRLLVAIGGAVVLLFVVGLFKK